MNNHIRAFAEICLFIIRVYLTIKLILTFGIITGIIILCSFSVLKFMFLRHVLGLEHLGGMDKVFLSADMNERYGIVSLTVYTNFNPENAKKLLIERIVKPLWKLRTRLVYKFFDYYWEEVPLEKALECIIIKPPFKDELAVKAYLDSEINNKLDVETGMPWQMKRQK